ncbi:hypothetical protein Lal_00044807 [Lupinus albus]|nr:hypothetical protein Lal_00044807 [Lupinus albus]
MVHLMYLPLLKDLTRVHRYRKYVEQQSLKQKPWVGFKWLQYENYVNNLPREVLQYKKIWNRVRLQFRLVQDLPQPPQNLDALHRIQTGQPDMQSGLNIGVIRGIKSNKVLKSNIQSTHNNI